MLPPLEILKIYGIFRHKFTYTGSEKSFKQILNFELVGSLPNNPYRVYNVNPLISVFVDFCCRVILLYIFIGYNVSLSSVTDVDNC